MKLDLNLSFSLINYFIYNIIQRLIKIVLWFMFIISILKTEIQLQSNESIL